MRTLTAAFLLASSTAWANEVADCLDTLNASAELAPIAKVVQTGKVDDTPFEMLVNTNKPTEQEKAAIAAWVNGRKNCLKLGESLIASWPEAARAINAERNSRFEALTAQLYKGELTYGEYATQRQKHQMEFSARFAVLAHQEAQQRRLAEQQHYAAQEQHRAQEQQRQMEFSRSLIEDGRAWQQMGTRPSEPRVTHCTQMGHSTVCREQ